MKDSFRMSIVVPTRDRAKDLAELLMTVLEQRYPPSEIIVVDDSPFSSSKQVADSFTPKFGAIGCELKYVKGSSDGLPAARNLGVKFSRGDVILFLDDDTLLDKNTSLILVDFLKKNSAALGVQPNILSSSGNLARDGLVEKFSNAFNKLFMCSYYERNMLRVRASGAFVFPNPLTKIISAQKLSGCCCYKREVFSVTSFDSNLKRWGFSEDLDFSYRVYKKNPGSLYVVPGAIIIHKTSGEARLPTKLKVYMMTMHWFYLFFKNMFESSIPNLIAFLLALTGNLLANLGVLIIKKKPRPQWWSLIYLLGSYGIAFRNLKSIYRLRLDFFNRNFTKQNVM